MEYLIVGLVLLAVLVLLGIGLVTSRQRRRLTGAAPQTLPAPDVDVAAPPSAPDTLQLPEAPATRLARLRARLARSGSTLGAGLLTLLSRENLDQATWDEVEETLLLVRPRRDSDRTARRTAAHPRAGRRRQGPGGRTCAAPRGAPRARRPDPRPHACT